LKILVELQTIQTFIRKLLNKYNSIYFTKKYLIGLE